MSDFKDYDDDGLLDEEQEAATETENDEREIPDVEDIEVSGGYTEEDFERDQRTSSPVSESSDDEDYNAWGQSGNNFVNAERAREFKQFAKETFGRDWEGGTDMMSPGMASRFIDTVNKPGAMKKNIANWANDEKVREAHRQLTGRKPWTQ